MALATEEDRNYIQKITDKELQTARVYPELFIDYAQKISQVCSDHGLINLDSDYDLVFEFRIKARKNEIGVTCPVLTQVKKHKDQY